MPGIAAILRVLLSLLAGVGVAHGMDTFFSGRKGYVPVSPGIKPGPKLFWFLAAFGGGALVWNFVNRRFHILSRRHAPRRKTRRRR